MKRAIGLTGFLALSAASPALALPRLTGGIEDYFLMPFLGYVALLAAAQAGAFLRGRLGRS